VLAHLLQEILVKKGKAILHAYEERLRKQRDATLCPAVCGWCGETFVGTLKQTRLAYARHLKKEHPEVKVKKKFTQARTSIMHTSTGKTLHDNIVSARTEGAAAWVGTEDDPRD
jgi:hypothetical protein